MLAGGQVARLGPAGADGHVVGGDQPQGGHHAGQRATEVKVGLDHEALADGRRHGGPIVGVAEVKLRAPGVGVVAAGG